jgi:hypothetical protein
MQACRAAAGRAPHAHDLEQLARLRLQALGAVDQHDRIVRGRERPVRVLREVLMPAARSTLS